MRIYTRAGDLAFKLTSFPDGQPHFTLETYEREFNEVTIEAAIKSTNDLFQVGQAVSVLRGVGYSNVGLDIRYLMGARMDRAIDWAQPFTLELVARTLNSYGLNKIRILDAHSNVATKLIRNGVNVLPYKVVEQVINTLGPVDVVIPDKGATERCFELAKSSLVFVHQCYKARNPQTGALSGFTVPSEGITGRSLLIVDDICDGGGTFVGLAKELRAKGAAKISLFVTHNVQNKDRLEGIDTFFTTNSYDGYGAQNLQIDSSGKRAIRIPISMKEL